jgi:hypothetical protein
MTSASADPIEKLAATLAACLKGHKEIAAWEADLLVDLHGDALTVALTRWPEIDPTH